MSRLGWIAVLVVLAVTGHALRTAYADSDPAPAPTGAFPHDRHSVLFVECADCHEGNVTLADPDDCAMCHDGDGLAEVAWTGPSAAPERPYEFDHELHVDMMDCADCHEGDDTGDGVPEVVRGGAALCFDCHDGGGPEEHVSADVECAMCHAPVWENQAWTLEAVAAFPMPESHSDPDFLSTHGVAAAEDVLQCATCHARESCESCHLDPESVASIQALGRDPRIASIAATRGGQWPRPANHDDPEWMRIHGDLARSSDTACATCHTRSMCEDCHGAQTPPAVAATFTALVEPEPDGPQGARGEDTRPPLHDEEFAHNHGAAAATGSPKCEACHNESQCEDCHQATVPPSFHGFNYVERHAADAFSQDLDCASCHSTEVFCRSCHLDAGNAPTVTGGLNGYHDRHPNWLLAHAVAARQNMETCASCHQQKDCLRCHSRAGWGVNPHGEGFEAQRMLERNPVMCLQCHFSSDFR